MTCRFTGRFIVYVLIVVCQKYMNVSHVSVLLLVYARKSRISFKCYLRHFTDQMVSATAQPCVFGGNSRRLGDAFRRQLPFAFQHGREICPAKRSWKGVSKMENTTVKWILGFSHKVLGYPVFQANLD